MINYTPTPDYYNDYICHYNHNHDPKNGQFTSGNGGGLSFYMNTVQKATESGLSEHKERVKKAMDNNGDMFNDILYREKHSARAVDKKEATKDFKKAIKEAAKEAKITKQSLEKEARKQFNDREKEISEKQNKEDLKIINDSRKDIAKQISADMISDFKRWINDSSNEYTKDDLFKTKDGKKMSESKMQKYLEGQVFKQLETVGKGANKPYNNSYRSPYDLNKLAFSIDGVKEFSDGQPLYLEMDAKTKKLKNWGYA